MKTFLKILVVAVGLVVVVVAAGLIWFSAKGSETMLAKIDEAAQTAGYELKVQNTSLGLFPPRWIWKTFSLRKQDGSITLNQDTLSLGTKWKLSGLWSDTPLVHILISLEEPELTLHIAEEEKPTPQPSSAEPQALPAVFPPVDVGLTFRIKDGKVTWSMGGEDPTTLEDFDLNVTLPSAKRALIHSTGSPGDHADLTAQFFMSLPAVGPLEGQLEVGLAQDLIVVPRGQIKVLGAAAQLRGSMNHVSGEQSWSVRANTKDFTQLPGTDELPARLTGGELLLSLDAQRGADTEWRAHLDFQAKALKGAATFKEDDLSSEGEFAIQAFIKARYENGQIEMPPFQLAADFAAMDIRFKDMFQKPKGAAGRISLKGSHAQNRLLIENLTVQVGELSLQAAGQISSLTDKPQVQLNFQVPLTQAKALKDLVPMVREYPYSGSLAAKASVQGPALNPERLSIQVNPLQITNLQGGLDFKSEDGKATAKGNFKADGEVSLQTVFKDLKSARGRVSADLSGVALKWDSLAEKPSGTPFKLSLTGQMGALKESENPLKGATAQYQMNLGQLLYDGLKFSGISTQGELKGGKVLGSAKMDSAFGGVVQAKSYSADVLSETMRLQSEITTQSVDLQKLTEWLAPDWKESVGGKLQSTVKLEAPFPLPEGSVINAIRSSGQFKVTEFFLKSGQINQMIHKKLESLTGLGEKVQLKEQTVHATVDGRFTLNKGVMDLPSMKMITTQNDDIQLSGKILADQRLDLKGVAHMANPPVRGTILAANSDAQGRLVLPLAIAGTVTDPDPQILEATVQKLLENTVKYEVKQQTKKVESKVKDTLEKEAKKLLDGLFK